MYNSDCVPTNVCCSGDVLPTPERTVKDNLIELTEALRAIESEVDCLRKGLWVENGDKDEKDIEIRDIDSSIVFDLIVARRIIKKITDTVSRLGI